MCQRVHFKLVVWISQSQLVQTLLEITLIITLVTSLSFLEPIVLGTSNFACQDIGKEHSDSFTMLIKKEKLLMFWRIFFESEILKRVFSNNVKEYFVAWTHCKEAFACSHMRRSYFEFPDLHRTEISTLISANISLSSLPFSQYN